MALAGDGRSQAALGSNGSLRLVGAFFSATLMLIAANCFLKYLWWTACSSAWSGIPKLHDRWQAAAARASLYGWAFIVLEIAIMLLLCTVIRLRHGLRVVASLAVTLVGTGLFSLALSWMKQGVH